MAILMSCPGCQKRLRADESIQGRRVRCSGCGLRFIAAIDGLPKAPPPPEVRPGPPTPPVAPVGTYELEEPEAAPIPAPTRPPARVARPAVAVPRSPSPPPDEPELADPSKPRVIVVADMKAIRNQVVAAVAIVLGIAVVTVVVQAIRMRPSADEKPEGSGRVPGVALTALDDAPRPDPDGFLEASDPDGDCRVLVDGRMVGFEVPGTFHDLSGAAGVPPVSGRRNAPRALRPIAGDFVLEGSPTGDIRPDDKPVGVGAPYHGVGLLAWKDSNNFIRLERAAVWTPGRVHDHANFVFCRRGRVEQVKSIPLAKGTTSPRLRLERTGNEVKASVRGDDGGWRLVESVTVDWRGDWSIGAAAVNSSARPLYCRVEGIAFQDSSGPPPPDGAAAALAAIEQVTRPAPTPAVASPPASSSPSSPASPPPAMGPPPASSERVLQTSEIVQRCEPSVALVRGKASSGTGFVVRPGLIATNAHVIEDELLANLEVRFPSANGIEKSPQRVELMYEDRARDLALLRVPRTPPPLGVVRDFRYIKGEDVVVIGSPGLGAGEVLENAVSRGVLSVKANIDGFEFYQLGIAINPGNSGGPVFDARGRVIGVATLKTTKQEALAFCVPSGDLAAAIGRMEGTPMEHVREARARHDVKPTFKLLAVAAAIHAAVLDMHAAAKARNIPVGDKKLTVVREGVANLEQTLFSGLGDAADTIGRDGTVPNDLRDGVTGLARELEVLRDLLRTASQGQADTIGSRLGASRRICREIVGRLAKRLDDEAPEALLAMLDGSYVAGEDVAGNDAAPRGPGMPSSPAIPFPIAPDMSGFRDRFGIGPRIGPRGASPFTTPRPPIGGSRTIPRGRSRLGR